jgi:phytoene dehydrogenase-like protein
VSYDVVVIGSGPNGLAAAITLAQADLAVLVVEAKSTAGGGMRTQEITCLAFITTSARQFTRWGWPRPSSAACHWPITGWSGSCRPSRWRTRWTAAAAVAVTRSLDETAADLGSDGAMWRRLFAPLVANWPAVIDDLLAPFHIPRHPLLFGAYAPLLAAPATWLAKTLLRGERARAVIAGMAWTLRAAVGAPADCCGRSPVDDVGAERGLAGGARRLAGHRRRAGEPFAAAGRDLVCGWEVTDLANCRGRAHISSTRRPPVFCASLAFACRRLPASTGALPLQPRRLQDRLGAGRADPVGGGGVQRAATVHVGGTLEEIAASERAVWRGEHPVRPFVLLAQQSLFDPTRAPAGKQVAWAYCHVPNGSTVDMTEDIERQVERFAPGFRDRILARSTRHAAAMEAYNPNYVGGDINGGVQDLFQHFTRPSLSLTPYRTPAQGIYICSSSTPPGGGVHGMCGYSAAQVVLADLAQRQ